MIIDDKLNTPAIEWDPRMGSGFIFEAIDPAWCSWFTGFVDGEGHFQIYFPQKKVRPWICLSLKLREDDQAIIWEICQTLRCGSVYRINAQHARDRGEKASDQFMWRVIVTSQIEGIIIPLFDSFPLRTKKLKDYMIWREAAMMLINGEYQKFETRTRLMELQDQLRNIRRGPLWKRKGSSHES